MSSASDTPSSTVRPDAGPRRTLYVDTCGAVVRKEHRHFVVDQHTDEGTSRLRSVPLPTIDTLALVGRVHCTMPALRLALRSEVQVVLLSRYGTVKGRLRPADAPAVDVRMAQYAAHTERATRCALACRFVGAKLHNMERRLRRSDVDDDAVDPAIRAIARLSKRVGTTDTVDALVGLEGSATRAYFNAWPVLIKREKPVFQFSRRTRRPPEDAVNALLGFVYSLLEKDVHAACIIAGLDPYLGLLHTPRPRTPSAVLDLMEAFRPVVADSVVLSLVNRRRVDSTHFEQRDGGVYLTEEGRKRVYEAYGKRRSDTVTPPGRDQALPYYRVFELQARRLARTLEESRTDYTAFRRT